MTVARVAAPVAMRSTSEGKEAHALIGHPGGGRVRKLRLAEGRRAVGGEVGASGASLSHRRETRPMCGRPRRSYARSAPGDRASPRRDGAPGSGKLGRLAVVAPEDVVPRHQQPRRCCSGAYRRAVAGERLAARPQAARIGVQRHQHTSRLSTKAGTSRGRGRRRPGPGFRAPRTPSRTLKGPLGTVASGVCRG